MNEYINTSVKPLADEISIKPSKKNYMSLLSFGDPTLPTSLTDITDLMLLKYFESPETKISILESSTSDCCNLLNQQQANNPTHHIPIQLIKHKILNPFIDFDRRNPRRYFY